MQFQLGQEGILSRILKVGESYCLMSILDRDDRDPYVTKYAKMFYCWFDDLWPWANLNLAIANQHWCASLGCLHSCGMRFLQGVGVGA